MINLLMLMYDPTGGRIAFGDVDLREILIEIWHRKIGVLFQDFAKYDMTARDSIGFGDIDRYLSGDLDDDIRRNMARCLAVTLKAVRICQVASGKRSRRLARLFAMPTFWYWMSRPRRSTLPRKRQMYDRFETLAAGKSAIYVTHRMASTKRTGHVLVLGNGRLLEYGTHAELMAHNGDYARMYSLQANRYTN